MIPKIVIQTWRSAELPEGARQFCESWRLRNPDFEYRFYDDAACRALVADTVPEYLDSYDAFPHAVMRADFFRYAAIYRHGGIYADIDMECVRPFGRLLGLAPVLMGLEAHLTKRRQRELGYRRAAQIANCILLSEPSHPFFLEAMGRAVAEWDWRKTVARSEIEDLTGPRMLTRLFYERRDRDIAVARQMVLTPPLHYPDISPLNALTYARHHFFGSWKARDERPLARRWIERDRWPSPFGSDLLDRTLTGGTAKTSAG